MANSTALLDAAFLEAMSMKVDVWWKCNCWIRVRGVQRWSPPRTAFLAGRADVVRYLVHETEVEGASSSGMSQLFAAIVSNDLDIVRILVETGDADVTRRSPGAYKGTALHLYSMWMAESARRTVPS